MRAFITMPPPVSPRKLGLAFRMEEIGEASHEHLALCHKPVIRLCKEGPGFSSQHCFIIQSRLDRIPQVEGGFDLQLVVVLMDVVRHG